MKKLILGFCLALVPVLGVYANEGGVHLEDPAVDLTDHASLQRGARLFVNYCMGCHSLKYERYQRMGEDLGIPKEAVKKNLMFTADKIGEPMAINMRADQAAEWFGASPPDLSLITRRRGEDWIYTYLRSFYKDDSRPWGVNNTVFPKVGMPHVLWRLQGVQRLVSEEGGKPEFELIQKGSMDPEEFDSAMRDLTAFLAYVAEPIKVERQRLGVWVLLFISVFFVLAYLLKKEYWKDVH